MVGGVGICIELEENKAEEMGQSEKRTSDIFLRNVGIYLHGVKS
jgi:hypothetical protein